MPTNTTHNTHMKPHLSILPDEERIVWDDPGSSAPQVNSRTTPELISFISWVSRSAGKPLRFPFFMAFRLFQWAVTHIDRPDSPFNLPNDQIDPVGYYEKIVNITQEAILHYQHTVSLDPSILSEPPQPQVSQGADDYDMKVDHALIEWYISEIEFLRAQLSKKDDIIQSGQSTINTLSQLLASKHD